MKQIGYAVLFLMLVIILIPLLLVKGCSKNAPEPVPKKVEEKLGMIKVYIEDEHKVVEMDFNEYLKGVVAAEMPASFNIEALKAQAIVARTYFIHRYLSHKKSDIIIPEHQGADICTNPAHCKAWISKEKAMERWGLASAQMYWDRINQAVDETVDIIVTYDDEPIDAVFHSTSSGRTENSEEVWSNIIPYLRSIESEGEELSPKYLSVVQISLEEFKTKLVAEQPDIVFSKDIKSWIQDIEKTQGGSIKNIRIGGCDFKGTEIRSIFGLNSANFSIEISQNEVKFQAKGYGHGVGMSQYGANYLAEQGKDYREILNHYYNDITIKKIDSKLLNP